MTLIQLECFLRTAENHSFTAAAEQMFISRQAVSANVKALEDELGFPLFQRGGRSIALTGSGEIMYRALTDARQRFHSAVKNAAAQNEEYQEISIGICEMNKDWSPKLYAFAEEHPNCRLNIETLPLSALEQGLIGDRFDIVLSFNDALPPGTDTSYGFELMEPLQLVIAMSKQHPLAQRESLDFPDLQNECLFTVSDHYSHQTKSNIIGHFQHMGCHPQEVREFPNYKSLEIALINGGVCVVFDLLLENRGNRLKLFPVTPLTDIRLMVSYKQSSSPLVKELARFLSGREQ